MWEAKFVRSTRAAQQKTIAWELEISSTESNPSGSTSDSTSVNRNFTKMEALNLEILGLNHSWKPPKFSYVVVHNFRVSGLFPTTFASLTCKFSRIFLKAHVFVLKIFEQLSSVFYINFFEGVLTFFKLKVLGTEITNHFAEHVFTWTMVQQMGRIVRDSTLQGPTYLFWTERPTQLRSTRPRLTIGRENFGHSSPTQPKQTDKIFFIV